MTPDYVAPRRRALRGCEQTLETVGELVASRGGGEQRCAGGEPRGGAGVASRDQHTVEVAAEQPGGQARGSGRPPSAPPPSQALDLAAMKELLFARVGERGRSEQR
jgi:hypothetical protein